MACDPLERLLGADTAIEEWTLDFYLRSKTLCTCLGIDSYDGSKRPVLKEAGLDEDKFGGHSRRAHLCPALGRLSLNLLRRSSLFLNLNLNLD